MKYMIWTIAAVFMVLAASCDLLNPTANQATVEASYISGSCGITVNLDGNNSATLNVGSYNTFPLVGAGSHTLNFSTGGQVSGHNCVFTNSGNTNYSATFNAQGGKVYVGTISENGGLGYSLVEAGP
jgi:hypothetical protein